MREATYVFALKTKSGDIIASEYLNLQVSSKRKHPCDYRVLLPPECVHRRGILLSVELPLPLVGTLADDGTHPHNTSMVSVRTYLNGKLLHEGPYRQRFWHIADLTVGTHELEIRVVDQSLRPVLDGFRRSFFSRASDWTGIRDSINDLCDFDHDPIETLSLSASNLPSQEDVHVDVAAEDRTIQLASPIEGDCVSKDERIHLAMHWPFSSQVMSSHDRLLLVRIDGSAAMLRLKHGELPRCFEVDSANMLNRNEWNTLEHILKVFLVASDWTLLAESLPVRLLEQNNHSSCTIRTFAQPKAGCARLQFSQEPSAALVESIRNSPRRRECGLSDRIDGIWCNGSFVPFFCHLREFSVDAAQACVRNKTIVFAGTSVVRGLYFGLLRKLGLSPTFVEGRLAVTRQMSSNGKVVESNWWACKAEMTVCPKLRRDLGESGSCRSGCWSCMQDVGGGLVAFMWTRDRPLGFHHQVKYSFFSADRSLCGPSPT